MMTRDQIQTVLDALEYIKLHVPFSDEDGTMYSESAIAILTAALAEPSEPVAWQLGHRFYTSLKDAEYAWRNDCAFLGTSYVPEPLFTHPASKPEPSEPVGQLLEEAFGRGQVMWITKPAEGSFLFTHPAPSKPEPSEPDCSPNHLCNGRMVHLPNGEQCDKCGETP